MPDERFDAWVKDAFGVDPASYAKPAAAAAAPKSQNLGDDILGGIETFGRAVGGAIATGAKAVEETVVAGAKAVGEFVESGVKAIGDGIVAFSSGPYDAAMKRLDAQIKGVKDAGLDATPYEAQAKGIRDAYAELLTLPDLGQRMSAAADLGKRADGVAGEAEADVARLKKSAVEGVGAAITGMRDGAKELIDKLPKENAAKPDFVKRLADLDKTIEETGKIADRAERAKQLKTVNKTAQKLFDDVSATSTDKSVIQKVYAKALKDRYGFDITNPSNMPNTHLDQVYKMFDLVPEADIVQNKMQTLTYAPVNDDGTKNTGAAYGGATIEMGDYGDENWGYKDPKTGNPAPANGFSISTLHELGHSVDDRFKVMDASQGKEGGGGWKSESANTVATAFIGEFKAGAGKTLVIDDAVLSGAVMTALTGGGAKKPDGMSDPDWAILQPLLVLCVSRRNDGSPRPWNVPHDIGGRIYHEAYSNEWWSYAKAVRDKPLTVRNYQWRAPGEWFAELYASSYYNSSPPPTGVDAAIAAYMYGGKSSSGAAPTS